MPIPGVQAYASLAIPIATCSFTKYPHLVEFTEHPCLCMPTNVLRISQNSDGHIQLPDLSCILNLIFYNPNRPHNDSSIDFKQKIRITTRFTQCATNLCETLLSMTIDFSDPDNICQTFPTTFFDSAIYHVNHYDYRSSNICDIPFSTITATSNMSPEKRMCIPEYGDYVLKVIIQNEDNPGTAFIQNIIPIAITPGKISWQEISRPPLLKFGSDGTIDDLWQ